jgi:hypothetical protein
MERITSSQGMVTVLSTSNCFAHWSPSRTSKAIDQSAFLDHEAFWGVAHDALDALFGVVKFPD